LCVHELSADEQSQPRGCFQVATIFSALDDTF
jgi:hypothetical protein